MIDLGGMDSNGSLSRGFNFGTNQNLSLNSGFNIQIAGKLTDDLNFVASINDNTLPFQPDGQTQNIQQFDRVFMQVFDEKTNVIVGDFDIRNDSSGYFLR